MTETNNGGIVSFQLGGVKALSIIPQVYAVELYGSLALAGKGIGIAYKDHAIGDVVECKSPNNSFQVVSGAAFNAGDPLMSDGNGKLITALATNRVIAIAIGSATGADEIVEAWVLPVSLF